MIAAVIWLRIMQWIAAGIITKVQDQEHCKKSCAKPFKKIFSATGFVD